MSSPAPTPTNSSPDRSSPRRSRLTSSKGSASRYVRDCICGRGLSCTGMTQAFRLLGDPRCYYVELPRYKENPGVFKYTFRNNLRAAYLRHLKRLNPRMDLSQFDQEANQHDATSSSSHHKRFYVALHHFHPNVVRAFYENPLTSAQKHKVPISITQHELEQFGVELSDEDRIVTATGSPTGGYYFCPSYTAEATHNDLKVLIKTERAMQKKQSPTAAGVPTNIDISKSKKTSPSSPEPVPKSITQEVFPTTKATPSPLKKRTDRIVPSSPQSPSVVANRVSPRTNRLMGSSVTTTSTSETVAVKDRKNDVVAIPQSPLSVADKVKLFSSKKVQNKEGEAMQRGGPVSPKIAAATSKLELSKSGGLVDLGTREAIHTDNLSQQSPKLIDKADHVHQSPVSKSRVSDFQQAITSTPFPSDPSRTELGEDKTSWDDAAFVPNEEKEAFPIPELKDEPIDQADNDTPFSVPTTSQESVKTFAHQASSNVKPTLKFDFPDQSHELEVPDEEISPTLIGSTSESSETTVEQGKRSVSAPIDATAESIDVLNTASEQRDETDIQEKESAEAFVSPAFEPEEQPHEPATFANFDESESIAGSHEKDTVDGSSVVKSEQEKHKILNDSTEDVFDGITDDDNAPDFDALWRDENDESVPQTDVVDLTTQIELEPEEWASFEPMEDVQQEALHIDSSTDVAIDAKKSSPFGGTRDHAWDTPKYRRKGDEIEIHKTISAGPAHFIAPSASNDTSTGSIEVSTEISKSVSKSFDSQFMESVDEDMGISDDDVSAGSESGQKQRYFMTSTSEDEPTEAAVKPMVLDIGPSKSFSNEQGPGTPNISFDSSENIGISTQAVMLNHQLPGSDPTLRIQVHNDLIALESMRRSEFTSQFEKCNREWKAGRCILQQGTQEVEFSYRLINGFAKAGRLFADSLQAVYEDKLHDDEGKAVKNSFFQNRLQKQRESQLESTDTEAFSSGGRKSSLLDSILESQLRLAASLRENADRLEAEIVPEIDDFMGEYVKRASELEALGNSILAELRRSEIDVKSVWDVFDAMVTGDLMEYTVQGSSHGGSRHTRSSLPSSLGGSLSDVGTVQGFLTPRDDGGAPIVSSAKSPLANSNFRQIGSVEDGWLVEMYYKKVVFYQQEISKIAQTELHTLFNEITTLEETRFRRIHQLMVAFVPRQRKLYVALPEPLQDTLNDLVGLRIDSESLQSLIDESLKNRSVDHLKKGASHRSGIMNRSRLKTAKESASEEVEKMESAFGNPFESPLIASSSSAELMQRGLRGMMNSNWSSCIMVVTTEGNLHIFPVPVGTPVGATTSGIFKSLCPDLDFDSRDAWVVGRKTDVTKNLTPAFSFSLAKCVMTIPKMRNRQLEITEARGRVAGAGGSRFLNAVKDRAQQNKKCTIRLASSNQTAEWLRVLEKERKTAVSK